MLLLLGVFLLGAALIGFWRLDQRPKMHPTLGKSAIGPAAALVLGLVIICAAVVR